jgi:hypothetical protein
MCGKPPPYSPPHKGGRRSANARAPSRASFDASTDEFIGGFDSRLVTFDDQIILFDQLDKDKLCRSRFLKASRLLIFIRFYFLKLFMILWSQVQFQERPPI